MLAQLRRHGVLAGVVLAYLVGFVVYGLINASAQVPVYAAVVALLAVGAGVLDARVGLGRPLLLGLAVWGAAHLAGGLVETGDGRVLYNLWLVDDLLRFDQVVHFFGFGLSALVCARILEHLVGPVPRTPAIAALVALMGVGVGGLNEVLEFVATRVFPETNVGGYDNTGWDLVANLAGSVVAAFVWARMGMYATAGEPRRPLPSP